MPTNQPLSQPITHALKEWQVAVNALAQGNLILLLRKGGIREAGGKFTVAHDRVLLYPTYEHQKPALLKPEYAAQVEPVASGWHPTAIQITVWAEITETLQIREAEQVSALLPCHIWNQDFATERLRWKPNQPLYILLLRVHQLSQPQTLPYSPEYGGCKSWIDLAEPIDLAHSTPVLSDAAFATQVAQIHAALTL